MTSLNKHFFIGPTKVVTPELPKMDELLGWHIARGSDIRLHPIVTVAGEVVGVLMGWLICQTGIMNDRMSLTAPAPGEDYHDWASDFCGRFVCLLDTEEGQKFYLDAGGLLGAVYSADQQIVASTPALIPEAENHEDLIAAFGIPERFGWYPFGLTPKLRVHRLMPNLALDLKTFETARFWPKELTSDSPIKNTIGIVHEKVTRSVSQCVAHGNVAAHLTAGYDSRMILAASWPVLSKLKFVTIGAIPGTAADLDASSAAALATRFDFKHIVRPYLPLTQHDRIEWFERTGNCIADHVTSLSTTIKSWDPDEIQLAGISGEVARAFYWTRSEIGSELPNDGELLKRLAMPDIPAVLAAAKSWRSTLPDNLSAPHFWDIVYLEQRLGCWAGPAVYGAMQACPSLSPFNTFAIYQAMLSLPAAYRASNRFPVEFISETEPDLNRIPYNRPFGLAAFKQPKQLLKGMLPNGLKTRLKRLKNWSK